MESRHSIAHHCCQDIAHFDGMVSKGKSRIRALDEPPPIVRASALRLVRTVTLFAPVPTVGLDAASIGRGWSQMSVLKTSDSQCGLLTTTAIAHRPPVNLVMASVLVRTCSLVRHAVALGPLRQHKTFEEYTRCWEEASTHVVAASDSSDRRCTAQEQGE